MHSGESETGLVADEFYIELSDSICENSNRIDIWISEGGDCSVQSVAFEDASRCGAQILFKWYIIRQRIDRFILNLDRDPHFGGPIVLDELLVKVQTAVDYGSRNSLIEVG